jgi:hypothetical protein
MGRGGSSVGTPLTYGPGRGRGTDLETHFSWEYIHLASLTRERLNTYTSNLIYNIIIHACALFGLALYRTSAIATQRRPGFGLWITSISCRD